MGQPLDPALKQAFRTALEEILAPRDDVIALQKANTQVLTDAFGAEALKYPLPLLPLDVQEQPVDSPAAIQTRLVELINTNVRLSKELTQLQEASRASLGHSNDAKGREKAPRADNGADDGGKVIDLQLKVNSLAEKRSRLAIFLRALDRLERLPAADPDYLHPTGMFHHCSALPEMPKDLMEGFTRDSSTLQHELEAMMRGLHKAVLRNKLLAQREKRKLDAMRAEDSVDPASLPAEVQLYALGAVKDHLITWIESQLMQAGDDDEEEEAEGGGEDGAMSNQATPAKTSRAAAAAAAAAEPIDQKELDEKLASIQREYNKHVELRKEISALLAEAQHVGQELETFRGMRISDDSLPAGSQQETGPDASPRAVGDGPSSFDPPAVLMLTPYLERLQAVAREQKALVQEKSHINSTLANQQQHMSQVVQDLVEESRLLSAYPTAASSREGGGHDDDDFGAATRAGTRTSVARQVEPFIYSADSAKIATLEAVVEKIELGQMAVDEAMATLGEVRKFLNKEEGTGGDGELGGDRSSGGASSAEAQGGGSGAGGGGRRESRRSLIIQQEQLEKKSIWSKLDGNLGLIGD